MQPGPLQIWVSRHPRAPNAPHLSSEQWEEHRELLAELYLMRGMTLAEVMVYMRFKHNFCPSRRQYTFKLRAWGFRKNGLHNTSGEMSGSTSRTSDDGVSISKCTTTGPSVSLDITQVKDSRREPEMPVICSFQQLELKSRSRYTNKAITGTTEMPHCESLQPADLFCTDAEQPLGLNLDDKQARDIGSANINEASIIEDTTFPDGSSSNEYNHSLSSSSLKTNNSSSSSLESLEELDEAIEKSTFRREEYTNSIPPTSDGVDSDCELEDLFNFTKTMFPGDEQSQISNGSLLLCGESVKEFAQVELSSRTHGQDKIILDGSETQDAVDAYASFLLTLPGADRCTAKFANGMQFLSSPEILIPSKNPREVADGSQPTFSPPTVPTHRVSPTALLLTAGSQGNGDILSASDLQKIEGLANFLAAAHSYEDSFSIYLLILQQNNAQQSKLAQIFSPVLCSTVNVTRTASTDENYKCLASLLKGIRAKTHIFNSTNSINGCLLQSYLGANFRARKDLSSAERYCHRAWMDYTFLSSDLRSPAIQAVIVTNLMEVLYERNSQDFDQLRQQQFVNLGFTASKIVYDALSDIFFWCGNSLCNQDSLVRLVESVREDMWAQSRSETSLASFESTLLFCYLWKCWRARPDSFSLFATQDPKLLSGALSTLETHCGIAPVEALSVVTNLIFGTHSKYRQPLFEEPTKANFVRRLSVTMNRLCRHGHSYSVEEFLSAFVSPLDTRTRRPSDQDYSILIRDFVRSFLEEHFDLRLSIDAFKDSRFRYQTPQTSHVSTFTLTPRSSWSGFRSFISIENRLKNGLGESIISSDRPRSEMSFSVRSGRSGSARLSTILPSPEEVSQTLQEKGGVSRIDSYMISAPKLISSTNTQVLTARALPSSSKTSTFSLDSDDDPMDLDP